MKAASAASTEQTRTRSSVVSKEKFFSSTALAGWAMPAASSAAPMIFRDEREKRDVVDTG
jgi:hypothetical protein